MADNSEEKPVQSEELKGTFIASSKGQEGLSELDSLIAETLSESKISEKPAAAQKEEATLAATPISKDFTARPAPAAEKPKQETAEIKPIPQHDAPTQSAPQEAAAKPQDQYEKTFKLYKTGDIVKGKVEKIDPTGVLVDIKYKSDGYINSAELGDRKLSVGEIIDVYIDAISTKEGHVALSLKKAEYEIKWNTLYDSFKYKKVVDVKVSSAVGGGLVVDYQGIRGFVPASHVSKGAESALSDFVGQTLPVKVIEIDRRRSKVIMSHRFGSVEKQRFDREKLFEQIDVGQILHGRVSSIKKFGAFVNVNGIEGLVHLNDLSWKRIDDPSKIVSIGQEVDVFVIGVDRYARKLSLGLKQLQPDPWAAAGDKYKAGQNVDVKILRIAKFGAFAELEEGIEGLIHVSELTAKNVQNPIETVKPGDIVKAKILRVIPEEQKIGLSIREVEIEEDKAKLKEAQSISQSQANKITIGDTIDESIKEQLSNNQNELHDPA